MSGRDLERAVSAAISAGGRGAVHRLTAASVLHAAEACSRIASDAAQIRYMGEMEVNRLYCATKLDRNRRGDERGAGG